MSCGSSLIYSAERRTGCPFRVTLTLATFISMSACEYICSGGMRGRQCRALGRQKRDRGSHSPASPNRSAETRATAIRSIALSLEPAISVANLPGATTFTVVPRGVRNGTSERASPERAAFETTYAKPAILGTARPAMEPTNTIRPNPSATTPGTIAWQHSITPVRLTGSTSFHSSSVRFRNGVGPLETKAFRSPGSTRRLSL